MFTNRDIRQVMHPEGDPNSLPGAPSNRSPDTEPHCTTSSILTSNTDNLAGYNISKTIGVVYGSFTMVLKDIKASPKSGGNGSSAKALTHAVYNARHQAVERMCKDCVSQGGIAIVGVSFGESEMLGSVYISIYGTAVLALKE